MTASRCPFNTSDGDILELDTKGFLDSLPEDRLLLIDKLPNLSTTFSLPKVQRVMSPL